MNPTRCASSVLSINFACSATVCARPVELGCHYETICASCTFFVTTIEFRPTLQAQRDDAARKGQTGRQKVYEGLLDRLDNTGS